VTEEDAEHMELYTQSESIRAAVKHERRVAGHHANGHQGNGHATNGQNGNGLGDAGHHHDHPEPRPEIIPPAA
jgi:hypothetical protein